MPPAAKTIHDEVREAHARASAIINRARTEERDLTPDEQKDYDAAHAQIVALASKRKRDDSLTAMLAQLGEVSAIEESGRALTSSVALGMRSGLGGILPLLGNGPGKLQLGASFVASEAFKALRAMPRSGNWQGPTVEIDAAVTIVPTTVIPPGVTVIPPAPVYPFDLVSSRFAQGTTDAGSIPYLVETLFTNAADYVAVGGVKPESAKEFTLASATLLKIAHIINVPDEFLDDVAGMQSYIDNNMSGGLVAKLEHEVVNGVGGAGKIMGLIPLPGKTPDTAVTPPDSLAVTVQKAAAKIWTTSRRRPDTVVLSPTTYIDTTMQMSPAFWMFPPGTPLGGLTPVQSPEVPDGTAIVGAFQQGSMLFRKGGIVMQATNSHAANFASNITTIRAEMRVALVHFVPQAYGLVTGLAPVAPGA